MLSKMLLITFSIVIVDVFLQVRAK